MDTRMENADILLVEDNPTDGELAVLALKQRNPADKLVRLKDGAEAPDFIFATGACSHRRIENLARLILLDLRLPKVDGLEVLRPLKADARTMQIPVVVVTSSREDRDVVESDYHGVNSYIDEPVEFNEFTGVVSELGWYWLFINHPPFPAK